ncbi:MAG: heme-binding domain-containing protein [Leeuwenhoekiella sp.]
MIWIKRLLVVALIALVAIQFIRPEQNDDSYESLSTFITETNPSLQVRGILKSACYDCHSNHTRYPWYAEVAPVSFWLQDHIEEGKEHLNFSNWPNYSSKRKDHKFKELIQEVKSSEMPLESYTWIHEEAKLNSSQTNALLDWAKGARLKYSLRAVAPQ